MEEIIKNESAIANLGTHSTRIASLKSQRNWAIGIGITIVVIAGVAYYQKAKEDRYFADRIKNPII